jgi:hypothetical protein
VLQVLALFWRVFFLPHVLGRLSLLARGGCSNIDLLSFFQRVGRINYNSIFGRDST